jgi:hypothetical protein
MTWVLTYLIPITIVTVVVALALLAAVHYALKRWQSHPMTAVFGPVAASVVIAAVVGPTFSHVWAMKRDLEQRQWSARVAHFERIRPILLTEAKDLLDYSRRIAEQGHLLGSLQGIEIARNEDLMWNRDLLVMDLESHFPAYALARAQLRVDVASHDTRLREVVDRVGAEFSVPAEVGNDDRAVRLQAGMALVHRCSRGGFGMHLEINQNGGHGYSYSAGGGGSNGGGAPWPGLLATWDAFRTYQPDASFTSACAELKGRADELSQRLARLANDANTLAEVTMLNGDCKYLH